GMLVRSIFPDPDGDPLLELGSFIPDHRTPLEQRWGGWYVTGKSASVRHMGNAIVSNSKKPELMVNHQTLNVPSLEGKFDTDAYMSPYSDMVALLVFEHQMYMTNLLSRLGWEIRVASYHERASGAPQNRGDFTRQLLEDAAREFVDYLFFIDEAPLGGRIEGTSGFAEKFAALGPYDSKGRSLRQFDLERRIMRYPCSYMIYSKAFDQLPAVARASVYRRMWQILSGQDRQEKYRKLSQQDRQAIVEILRDTKKDLPEYFGR